MLYYGNTGCITPSNKGVLSDETTGDNRIGLYGEYV